MSFNKDDIAKRMAGAVESLKHDFSGLRTGRANPALLDNIKVDVYGALMPVSQVASVSTPEARMLSVSVWDRSNVGAVEKAITNSGLGLNPIAEGQTIRISLPELTEERRKELAKVASQQSESARIAVRNVRRDGMDQIKKSEKDKEISEDDAKRMSDVVQKLTDDYIAKIDAELESKSAEIMKV
ncbi:MAG: ribosome recycling factor [Alphaproteobacteria bacterium CG11_big_fil_rev_8_21_14_0_20_44_7]|nr:MAG: ribosome recycling factor [Alphaproteobacteria bacterium CG11_big_fil_rev_8_21_14_0_20_44_7]